MKVHHLNCVTACPLGGGLVDGRSGARVRGFLVSHCLLVEHPRGLVLVDTGFGMRDVVGRDRRRIHPVMRAYAPPELRPEMTAIRQIQALGHAAHDVRHVVLSHLDYDHAGGLDDFPAADIHVSSVEAESAWARIGAIARLRYRPTQWSSRDRWHLHDPKTGDAWNGLEHVREIDRIGPEVRMVPLEGHTLGHCGVAVSQPDGWLLYAGDAYFHRAQLDAVPSRPAGLGLFERMMTTDRTAAQRNRARLRRLAKDPEARVTVFCAHDVAELEALSGRPFDAPVPRSGARETPPLDPPNPGDPGPALPDVREPTPIAEDDRIPHEAPPALGR
jgi:glyoxylase-like metal-dependent hydrolase (beta-lactamase superfamily II)